MVVRSTPNGPDRADGTGWPTRCAPYYPIGTESLRKARSGRQLCVVETLHRAHVPDPCNHVHNSPIAFRLHTITVRFDAQVKHPVAHGDARGRCERADGPRITSSQARIRTLAHRE